MSASFPGAQRRPGCEARPVYDTIKNTFMEDLDNLLGGILEEFSALNNFERTGFVLGCENWGRYDFKASLRLVKSFILLIWDTWKNKLYGDQDGNGETPGCSCSCLLTGDQRTRARGHWICGCVVNGVSATAAT